MLALCSRYFLSLSSSHYLVPLKWKIAVTEGYYIWNSLWEKWPQCESCKWAGIVNVMNQLTAHRFRSSNILYNIFLHYYRTINNSLFLFVRLQSPPEVSVGKIQQQRADRHHGAFWSREIHSDEYSRRLQVKCWIIWGLCRLQNNLYSLTHLYETSWLNLVLRKWLQFHNVFCWETGRQAWRARSW